MADNPEPWFAPSIRTMLIRGLSKRCPRCGAGRLFSGWFKMKQHCARCNLKLQREEAHFVGAMAINLIFTEIIFGATEIAWGVATWPHPPWATMTIAGVALNGVIPVLLYPISKTTWTAIDLLMHRFDPVDRITIELP